MNKLTVVGVPLSLLGCNLGLLSPAMAQDNSLLVIDNLTTLSPDAETFTPDNPINQTLAQIEQYDLQNQDNRIDLAPHLLRGSNIIKISGNYNPEGAAVTVKLSGPSTQIVQQASGNGRLNHIINLEVQ